jgi:hypothetical protein
LTRVSRLSHELEEEERGAILHIAATQSLGGPHARHVDIALQRRQQQRELTNLLEDFLANLAQ